MKDRRKPLYYLDEVGNVIKVSLRQEKANPFPKSSVQNAVNCGLWPGRPQRIK